ncbi:hypothetical protein [Streptomyces sp. NPDC007063]|uniref:hypothetical protein n=1 Tax=Streptomyces sp. NPDC007063 TaxID=3364772 RepID=UPI00369C9747
MLSPLVSAEELATWMQVEPGTLPGSVPMLLDAVSAIVRRECRSSFRRTTSTVTRTPECGWISLPFRPVASVDSVEVDGSAVPFEFYEEREAVWVGNFRRVRVTFTHGYPTVPADVKRIALSALTRALENPRELKQETVGSMSFTYAAELIGASLSQADRDALADYARRVSVVRLV